MSGLLIVMTLQLALFVVVCGAILWELRRARLEANQRGREGRQLLEGEQSLVLMLEEEVRKIRKGEREPMGVEQ